MFLEIYGSIAPYKDLQTGEIKYAFELSEPIQTTYKKSSTQKNQGHVK